MKQLITLLSVLFFSCTAGATVFTVITNADSGPGSLRDAITQANANGTTATDYIHFNIPQLVLNQRMIELVTELPALSSNIIIDGTTQPGNTYGTTDAKVCLKKNDYAPSFSMLKVENAQQVEIYGMVLYYGYVAGLFGPPYRSSFLYGVNIVNSSDVRIGAPGKSNVITGAVHSIFSDAANGTCTGIVIQSNYLGHVGFYDGSSTLDIDPIIIMPSCCITFADVKNVLIGGNTPAEGNIFGCRIRAINIDSRNSTGNGFITIRNNLFGRKYDKVTMVTNIYDFWDTYIRIGRSRNNPVSWSLTHQADYRVNLLDNDITSHASIANVSDSVIIKRNKFKEDFRNTTFQSKLALAYCTGGGIIGGTSLADSNVFEKKNFNTYYNSVGLYDAGPVTMLKNKFDCNSSLGSTTYVNQFGVIPFAQVDTTAPAFVQGRATAGAKVDLYYDDYCTACEGLSYLASVVADASGHWIYNGATNGTVIATATSAAGYTSAFSAPKGNEQNRIIKQPTCGKNNGSITNITSEGAEAWCWIKLNPLNIPDTVSRSIDLLNAGPGYYLLLGIHGGTCYNPISSSIQLEDITPKIQQSGVSVTHPSCGLFNGAVNGLTIWYGSNSVYKWINSTGQTIGTNININALGPGTYRFVVTDTTATGGCSDTATFTLINQSGPSLNTGNMVITPAACSNSNGAITGITTVNVTGTPFIQWVDSLNNPVGSTTDLLNVPPGKYRLKFKDQSPCDTIITTFYIVADMGGITIDTTGKTVTPSKCIINNGSISNIKVSNGQTYTWVNTATNAIVGNTLNLTGMPAGSYRLTVSNSSGCTKQSPIISIATTGFVPIAVSAYTLQHAGCLQNKGSVNATGFTNNAALYSFRWADSITSQTIGTGTAITNLAAGTYQLFATDTNGCPQKIFSATVNNLPLPAFNYSGMQLQHDQCSLNNGSITNITLSNLTGPTTYTWYNQNAVAVGNSIPLQHIPAGTYVLQVTDAGNCRVQSAPVTINNTNSQLPSPVYSSLVIPRHTDAALVLKSAAAGSYMLLPSAGATTALQQNNSGNFVIPAVKNDTVFYVRQLNGSCSSAAVAVSIKVVDRSYFAIPKAFTPNGDGLNDLLRVRVVGQLELKYFKVFNKWGEQVFETNNYSDGWDGTYRGVLQNTGSYIWIAEGRDLQGKLITDKGMFTLIR